MTDNKIKTLNTEIKTFFSSFLADVFLGSNNLSTHVYFKLTAWIVSHDWSVLRKTDCQWAKVGNGYLIHYYIAVCLSPSLLLHSFHSLYVFTIQELKAVQVRSCFCSHWMLYQWKLLVFLMEKFEHWLTNLEILYKRRCCSH